MGGSSIYTRRSSDGLLMQDSREIDYFGQRILQIVQPLAASEDRTQVLPLLAQSVANNFAADGCWVLQYVSPGVVRIATSACVSHRTNSISSQLAHQTIPSAPTPTQWRMPLLPDYQVMLVETRNQGEVTGCLVVATKGVEWYRETKLVFQIVADYVGVALIEADLQVQAQISQIYPKLHHRLTQAIVENQQIDRLFELAVSDMVEALQLKRGLVLTLKTSDLLPKPATTVIKTENESSPEIDEWDRPLTPQPSSPSPEPTVASAKTATQIQIVTTIDVRKKDLLQPLPSSFLLEDSYLCQTALANAPNPTIFDGKIQSTSTDRAIFQDDRLPSMAMIPLMGATIPDREPTAAIWGWLVLQHDRSRHWHPVELNLLQCQIYQIALARLQRKTLQQARTAIANRTSQVQTSLQLQAKLHDVSRKRMEKLSQANELKDEFISNISHELRTPLTSMSLAIKMLRQTDVDPERRQQYLDILDEQCQREIKLVNDILKLQQLDSRQLELRPQQMDLNQFITEQATIITDRWQPIKSLQLSLHLPSISPQIQTDADSLKHILEELLVNAGKFAIPQTMVEVWLKIDLHQAIFKIANLSQPISSEDLLSLFERFRRGTGTTQKAISGTGLGLALVKSMVEQIQGTITVTSEPIAQSLTPLGDGDNLPSGTASRVASGTEIAKTCFTVTIPTVLERH